MKDLPVVVGITVWEHDTEVTHSLVIGPQGQAMMVLPLEQLLLLVEQVSVWIMG